VHVGTFTRDGTWEAARHRLPALREVGVTVLEVMPVAEFAGRFGWGYDGVDLFAPTHLYGTPDEFRRFVDDAHATGLGVLLDVVYNHLGPSGNYLPQFAETYFDRARETEWGQPLNFDGEGSGAVRELVLANARHWISEFHLDGLRLDATQSIFDSSPDHILAAIARTVREAAEGRATIVVAEDEPQDARLVRRPESGGFGLDGLWNDDFHHAAVVAADGRREAYYTDYLGTPQELVSTVKYGFLYQGQRYAWQFQRRGTPAFGVPRSGFVTYLQNHDQIANSPRGRRLHQLTSPGKWRALTAFLLLGPGTPMMFQGQEFAASSPFLYFADHAAEPDLAAGVRTGRRGFLAQFRTLALPEWDGAIADPGDVETFRRSKVDHLERERHPEALALHRDLLRRRREDPVLRAQDATALDGAVLGAEAFVLRWFGREGDDRLLLVNLGRDLRLDPAPEPLLAPPARRRWRLDWSSEDRAYGGGGTFPPESLDNWRLPAESALLMSPGPEGDDPPGETWPEAARRRKARGQSR
jgi:maltooligosyltrehalose trehalohydrolase